MKKRPIYLSGPSFHHEEFESMKFLKDYLQKTGFDVFSSFENGFQNSIISVFSNNDVDEKLIEGYEKLCVIAFSLEFSKIINADACVGFLNGRVPDESTIIKMGIAFSMGIPVINYKFDCRILFPNGVNTMIQGLTNDFSQVKKIQKLPKAIRQKIKRMERITAKNNKSNPNAPKSSRMRLLSPYNKRLYNFGLELGKYIEENFHENLHELTSGNLIRILEQFEGNSSLNDLIPPMAGKSGSINEKGKSGQKDRIKGKVYCSGALFCPAEVRDMKHICDVIEGYGLSGYLPQRDGGEPYVMGSIDNPFAGAPIAIPVTMFLNKVLYSLDIYDIIKCEYFIVNLNGRAHDDGAMAELGVAFGAGKPIILFLNDYRNFYRDRIHPTFVAIGYSMPQISKFEEIPIGIERIARFIGELGKNQYYDVKPPNVSKFYNIGEKWAKKLEKRTPPVNPMEIWNKTQI